MAPDKEARPGPRTSTAHRACIAAAGVGRSLSSSRRLVPCDCVGDARIARRPSADPVPIPVVLAGPVSLDGMAHLVAEQERGRLACRHARSRVRGARCAGSDPKQRSHPVFVAVARRPRRKRLTLRERGAASRRRDRGAERRHRWLSACAPSWRRCSPFVSRRFGSSSGSPRTGFRPARMPKQ